MAQRREIDLHAIVAGRLAGVAVATALHGNQQLVVISEPDRVLNICRARGLDDQRGIFVDGCIQHTARDVVTFVAWQQEIPAQAVCQFLDRGPFE
jgi:hypothetical protein